MECILVFLGWTRILKSNWSLRYNKQIIVYFWKAPIFWLLKKRYQKTYHSRVSLPAQQLAKAEECYPCFWVLVILSLLWKWRWVSVTIYHCTGIDIFLRVKLSVFRHMSPSEVEKWRGKEAEGKKKKGTVITFWKCQYHRWLTHLHPCSFPVDTGLQSQF